MEGNNQEKRAVLWSDSFSRVANLRKLLSKGGKFQGAISSGRISENYLEHIRLVLFKPEGTNICLYHSTRRADTIIKMTLISIHKLILCALLVRMKSHHSFNSLTVLPTSYPYSNPLHRLVWFNCAKVFVNGNWTQCVIREWSSLILPIVLFKGIITVISQINSHSFLR